MNLCIFFGHYQEWRETVVLPGYSLNATGVDIFISKITLASALQYRQTVSSVENLDILPEFVSMERDLSKLLQ